MALAQSGDPGPTLPPCEETCFSMVRSSHWNVVDRIPHDRLTWMYRRRHPGCAVELWHSRTEGVGATLDPSDTVTLSQTEQARLSSYRFERDRVTFLASRLLLRSALSHYAAIAPADWTFTSTPGGKPEISPELQESLRGGTAARELRFSLSRSAGIVAVAVSAQGGDLGLDVEDGQRASHFLEIASSVLTPGELRTLPETPQPARARAFLQYWTLKEAYVKAVGLGLSLEINQLGFTADEANGIMLAGGEPALDTSRPWEFHSLCIEERYSAAIAYRATAP